MREASNVPATRPTLETTQPLSAPATRYGCHLPASVRTCSFGLTSIDVVVSWPSGLLELLVGVGAGGVGVLSGGSTTLQVCPG
jgi:hypothetical protein